MYFKQEMMLAFALLLLVTLVGCSSKNRPDALAKTWDNAQWDEATWR